MGSAGSVPRPKFGTYCDACQNGYHDRNKSQAFSSFNSAPHQNPNSMLLSNNKNGKSTSRFLRMKKEPTKGNEGQLLDLLKRVLPKATHDPKLAAKIYKVFETELKAKARATAFEKFCAKVELPNLEASNVASVKQQLAASFDEGDVTVKPNRKEQCLSVEVALPDGSQFSGEIRVNPNATMNEDGEQEITLKFIPFPVCLPGDAELVWLLAKRENLTPEEAAIALAKVEEEFWASKSGQKLQRDRVEKNFPEFIARVPAGMLSEAGLKRHYKTPEPLKLLRTLAER